MALEPRYVSGLFRPLLDEWLDLLHHLTPGEWLRRTSAGSWRVRDIVAHMFDIDLRKIAAYRDGHMPAPETPIASDADLGRFINGLNAGGVSWAARLSPRLLVELSAISGRWVADVIEHLPPHGPSLFAVSWAGESASENWMDTGREYTERWHHQAQVRDAVGVPLLLEPRWMDPLLDSSVRALPYAFRDVDASTDAALVFRVGDRDETTWTLIREEGRWELYPGAVDKPTTTVALTADAAWRLFYNGLSTDAYRQQAFISGDRRLADALGRCRSVVL